MQVIYEPRGRAKEYSPLALNHYHGCAHGCVYCFSPGCLRMKREDFHGNPEPRREIINKVIKDARDMQANGDDREINLCFTTDPYQPIDKNTRLTRAIITILINHNLRFTVLTKAGRAAMRDFDLLEGYDKCSFGTTLTLSDENARQRWEPNAAPVLDRIFAIREANFRQIKTWTSIEPPIRPEECIKLVKSLHNVVNHWKVGKLNYENQLPEHLKAEVQNINWVKFREDIIEMLELHGASYYIKIDLQQEGK
jgi:DNA repair photolyase